jgi:hypothetical protein
MMNKRPGVSARIVEDAETLAYMDFHQAQGITRAELEGIDVMMRPGSTRADVMHEWLHVIHTTRGLGSGPGDNQFIDAWLYRHSPLLRLDQ